MSDPAPTVSSGSTLTVVDESILVPTPAAPSSASSQRFEFEHVPDRPFESLSNPETKALLTKWGLPQPNLQLQAFRFDRHYARSDASDFLRALFTAPHFQYAFRLGDGRGGVTGAPLLKVSAVEFEPLLTTATTLDLFKPIEECEGMVRGDELTMCRMMDVYLPCGVVVADQVRGAFMLGSGDVGGESEYVDTMPSASKREFLYHIMWRVLAGGALNQYDDSFTVYKDVTRDLYRDMVNVARSGASDELEIQSYVYEVKSVAGGDFPLFPKDDGMTPSNHNWCYVVVNPLRREAVVFYHSFWSPF